MGYQVQSSVDLAALRGRRVELMNQITDLNRQQGRLVQERNNASAAGNQVVTAELDQRIQMYSERIKRVEAEKLRADDAIAAAIGGAEIPATQSGGAGTSQGTTVTPSVIDQSRLHDTYRTFMFAEAALIVLVGVIAWRLTWRRAMRRLGRTATTTEGMKPALDAIALEVERISENQRYLTKLLHEQFPDAVAQIEHKRELATIRPDAR